MYEFIWHWTKGHNKVCTRNTEIAEKAMKEGYRVMSLLNKPHIFGKLKSYKNRYELKY